MDIRILVMGTGIYYRDIARKAGITPEYLSRCMSKPLSPVMRERILQAIDKLKEEDWSGDATP